jgi:hypothetical protein
VFAEKSVSCGDFASNTSPPDASVMVAFAEPSAGLMVRTAAALGLRTLTNDEFDTVVLDAAFTAASTLGETKDQAVGRHWISSSVSDPKVPESPTAYCSFSSSRMASWQTRGSETFP